MHRNAVLILEKDFNRTQEVLAVGLEEAGHINDSVINDDDRFEGEIASIDRVCGAIFVSVALISSLNPSRNHDVVKTHECGAWLPGEQGSLGNSGKNMAEKELL